MLYCAVYCHGKLVGGGEAGREGREGKESWRERDSRKGGAEEGSIKIRWLLLSFFGVFFSFFLGFCDGLCRFWLCCCCCGLIRSWFVFVFLFCAVRLSGRVSGTGARSIGDA